MPATVSENGNQIRNYYEQYLGRPAKDSEVSDWVGTGKNIGEIEAGLRDHALANPAPVEASSADQIRDLYQRNFGREAVEEEVQDWIGTGKSASEVETGIEDHWEADRYRAEGTPWPGAASVVGEGSVGGTTEESVESEPNTYDITTAVNDALAPYISAFNSTSQGINNLTNDLDTARGERDAANAGWENATNLANSWRENTQNDQLSGLRSGSTVGGQNTSPYAGIVGGGTAVFSDQRTGRPSISFEDSVIARGPVVPVMQGGSRSPLTGGDGAGRSEDNRRAGLTSGNSGAAAANHYQRRFG